MMIWLQVSTCWFFKQFLLERRSPTTVLSDWTVPEFLDNSSVTDGFSWICHCHVWLPEPHVFLDLLKILIYHLKCNSQHLVVPCSLWVEVASWTPQSWAFLESPRGLNVSHNSHTQMFRHYSFCCICRESTGDSAPMFLRCSRSPRSERAYAVFAWSIIRWDRLGCAVSCDFFVGRRPSDRGPVDMGKGWDFSSGDVTEPAVMWVIDGNWVYNGNIMRIDKQSYDMWVWLKMEDLTAR